MAPGELSNGDGGGGATDTDQAKQEAREASHCLLGHCTRMTIGVEPTFCKRPAPHQPRQPKRLIEEETPQKFTKGLPERQGTRGEGGASAASREVPPPPSRLLLMITHGRIICRGPRSGGGGGGAMAATITSNEQQAMNSGQPAGADVMGPLEHY